MDVNKSGFKLLKKRTSLFIHIMCFGGKHLNVNKTFVLFFFFFFLHKRTSQGTFNEHFLAKDKPQPKLTISNQQKISAAAL